MTYEREYAHDTTTTTEATTYLDPAPGRAMRTDKLNGPTGIRASGLLSRKARDSNGVTDGAEQAVGAASSSSGTPLPDTLMRKFETSLGTDLSSVRLHTGSESASAASAVGARAYTTGQDIHFGAGQYDTSSPSGQHLIAHEVAHTVQQRGGSPTRQNKLEVSSPDDAFEHEADHAANAMVSGQVARVGVARVGVARIKDLADAADRGADKMDDAMKDPSATPMMVSNVNDKASASALLSTIRSYDGDMANAIATKQVTDLSMQSENTKAEGLLSDYLTSAEGQTAQISTFQGMFGMLMKDFARLDGMHKQFDGAGLAAMKDEAAAGKDGKDQAKEIFGNDDALKETERVKKIDKEIQTKLDKMNVRKAQLSTDGHMVTDKGNLVSTALMQLSEKQRAFLAAAGSVTSPEAQKELAAAKERAKHDYSAAAGKVLKDALMGAATGVAGGTAGGPAGAAAAGAVAGAKAAATSTWANVVSPAITKALEDANISVGAFPDNKAEADNVEKEKAAWLECQTKASEITTQAGAVRQATTALGTQFTAYEQQRALYESDMILLGQDMDKAAQTGRGPKPKDPCTCDPHEKPAPTPKDKGPRYEIAMQFLSEADRFIAQAEVVSAQGTTELAATPKGQNTASLAHDKLAKTSSAEAPTFFYSISRMQVKKADGSEYTKLTPIRNTFTLHNGQNPTAGTPGMNDETHQYGAADGNDGMGANKTIADTVKKVDEVKGKITAYRTSLASAIGV
jgi:Domain of unknown function (DUF4157)